ncbi:MAG: DUF711 family protein [Chloroflexi bacterium]|nr:DUF711 family protein [Chloroflexota bacterium]
MKIRSVTYFDSPGHPLRDEFLDRSGNFISEAQKHFNMGDIEVQTIRFAAPPFPTFLDHLSVEKIIDYARELEGLLNDQGYLYISLGPALPEFPESYPLVFDLIQNTENTFFSGLLTEKGKGISLPAVKACGEIIHQLSPLDPDGFKNLYFAALGNLPAGAPFFPAAYHDGKQPSFAIAIEGADLAVEAFSNASSFEEARQNLVRVMEKYGQAMSLISRGLEESTGITYRGLDYSLAPFPEAELSIGTALEALGIKKLGQHGSLTAAAFLADTIDRADFLRVGFSGLMLAVLEDAVLAERAAEGSLGIKDLLLYAAVCGTGLDTVPLPGDISPDQISAVLMDLSALSLRLNKPLTARLMPIPGKKAGDKTSFDFPFFANSKVMGIESAGLSGLFDNVGYLDIQPRPKS